MAVFLDFFQLSDVSLYRKQFDLLFTIIHSDTGY